MNGVASALQGTELMVDGQDVMVQLCGKQQVLQSAHVLLDGHMVLKGNTHTQALHPV